MLTLSTTLGTTPDHGQAEVPSLPEKDGVHIQSQPTGRTGITVGKAGVVLVSIQEERDLWRIVIQMVRTMAGDYFQTTGFDITPVRVVTQKGKTRNPERGGDR